MSQIKPFKAIHYNQEKIGDLSKVTCPPYDVISREEQIRYHNLHPNNFIHVLLGVEKENDNAEENKYTRAKKIFKEWLRQGILQEDVQPAIYYYKQEYTIRGEKHSRLGFISLMRIQDEKGEAKIFPHENVQSKAKEDRLKLWRSLKINCSPIFVCFSDKDKKVDKIFSQKVCLKTPFVDIVDNDRVSHRLWRLDDEALILEVQNSLEGQNLFIADGHHRYEVAREYRRLELTEASKHTGEEPYNFIMTYFTSIDSRDLLILPIHRIVKSLKAPLDFLEEFFKIDKVKTKEDFQILLARAGQNEHAFGLYTKEGMKLLRLKNRLLIDRYIKEGSKEFRSLDATILKNFILDHVGIHHEDITYVKDFTLALDMVDNHQADASFIMNSVKVQELKTIALSGERMPPKTTYFYPKVLSGLTIHNLE